MIASDQWTELLTCLVGGKEFAVDASLIVGTERQIDYIFLSAALVPDRSSTQSSEAIA
jgi:hypothetical protein